MSTEQSQGPFETCDGDEWVVRVDGSTARAYTQFVTETLGLHISLTDVDLRNMRNEIAKVEGQTQS